MHVTKQTLTPTNVKLTVTADDAQLERIKKAVLTDLAKSVRVQGFRSGKAPLNLVEKNVDQSQLQTDFLQLAVNELYVAAVEQERVRPVSQPNINVVKFVPFTTLEITAEVESVGEVSLPDYTKITVAKKAVNITDKQIDDVIKNLQSRTAKKTPVKRPAKNGDEVVLDFFGTDASTKEPVSGADGKDYPLILGSNSFIPGFETALVGLKAGDTKDIPLTFPKDYGVKALQGKKVNFAVTIHQVQELIEPKVDAAFAATIGPFKSVSELRTDIRRELTQQQAQENERRFENDLLEKIAKDTKVAIPESMVDEEVERLEQQERQNIAYRGQTWQEHLDEEGLSAEDHRAKNKPGAELRVKAGLILGEIAEKEGISVTQEELEIRLQVLKGQYKDDPAMRSEIDKPENRRDVMNRLLTEKTLDKLKSLSRS